MEPPSKRLRDSGPKQPVRWGIMGAGHISADFVGALKALPPEEGVVVAVGARTLSSAQRFADSLGVAKAYEGYAALANDPDVDVVYVGTVAQAHVECARIALAAGKACLVEKPLALNAWDAASLVKEARAKELFLMEGMWTRCFPAIRKVRELLTTGAIGDVMAVCADFGWPADPYGEHARTLDPLSGGVSMDVAMYPLGHVLLAAGRDKPRHIVASGSAKSAAGGSGVVDWSVGAVLSGFPQAPRLTATVLCTLDASTPEEVVYTGTKGTLRVHRAAHTPSKLTLSLAASREEAAEQTFDFPLPAVPEGALPFTYPGSQGFIYEAEAVHAALRAGLLEAPEWTHEESVTTQSCIDSIRQAVAKEWTTNAQKMENVLP